MAESMTNYRAFRLELFTTYATLRITTDAARPMDTPISGVAAKQAMLAAITELSTQDKHDNCTALDITRDHMLKTVKRVGSFHAGREEQVHALCEAMLQRHGEIRQIIDQTCVHSNVYSRSLECEKICQHFFWASINRNSIIFKTDDAHTAWLLSLQGKKVGKLSGYRSGQRNGRKIRAAR